MIDNSPLTEHQRQVLHFKLFAHLIDFIFEQGYEATWGEAYRTPEQAALDAQKHIGIAASLHTNRMAVDVMLFKDGVYLQDPEPYKVLADYWVTLHPLFRAGYNFTSRDADHFSITFQGRQ